ncbi:uncharacterized protein LOC126285257, partial [Schistocerca gregaria]|uniref:uncharacterized protein LOC126285257 n=1 Tax=Schistocerca gregaria TaxID=7010 RepID=UPI00211F26EB
SARQRSVALRDVRVSVPAAIQRGTAAVLRCRYDLEGDALYSVKWYKGRREFFRYTPRENPAIKVFPFAGLTVDKSRSNATQITLPRVDVGLSGRYSCEVSADAPSFHTHLVSGDMAVVEVPDDVPSISGVKPRYRTGDTLNATCSSTWSRPAATLLWIVNEEPGFPLWFSVCREWLNEGLTDRSNDLLAVQPPSMTVTGAI